MTSTCTTLATATLLTAVLAACSTNSPTTMAPSSTAGMSLIDNSALPEPVRVPAGLRMKMATTGVGEITYECRDKAGAAGQHEWAFVGPVATLYGGDKKTVGKYYAGPTWEASDGSKITGKQVAVSPAGAGNIPLQLVKTDPAMGAGAMSGVAYIQRLNTKGGVAPASPCDAAAKGKKEQIRYQADYVFYSA